MFKVIYDEEKQTCTLECPWCRDRHESNFPRPNPMSVLFSHFNEDANSGITVCNITRLTLGETPWQAVTSHGHIIARGRAVVKLIGSSAIDGPQFVPDDPKFDWEVAYKIASTAPRGSMIPPPLRWGTFPEACNAGIARHGEASMWRRLSDGEDAPLSDHADEYTGGSDGEWAFDETRLLYRRRAEETPSERFVLL